MSISYLKGYCWLRNYKKGLQLFLDIGNNEAQTIDYTVKKQGRLLIDIV